MKFSLSVEIMREASAATPTPAPLAGNNGDASIWRREETGTISPGLVKDMEIPTEEEGVFLNPSNGGIITSPWE